jgi:DNA processing protein
MLGVQAMGPLAPSGTRAVTAGSRGAVERASDMTGDGEADRRAREEAGGLEPPVAGLTAGPLDGKGGDERDAWVTLLTVPGLGPVAFTALLSACGSARAVIQIVGGAGGPERLREALVGKLSASPDFPEPGPEASGAPATTGRAEAPGRARGGRATMGGDLARRIRDHLGPAAEILETVRRLKLAVVTLDDPDYPDRLRQVDMPPPLLFVRGAVATLSARSAVAVVGTRWPTDRGRQTAAWIGAGLARAGAVVVSGLAVGIDGAAHAAVVGESLPTVAVLGGGHARLFPRAHERLADEIVAAGGAVVAELPPDTPASRGTFPRRNRLISGLTDATVVVEAGVRSGALITAGWALEQGRECFIVPGPIDAPASAGCLAFLRAFPGQTRVVCGIAELVEDLGLARDDRDAPGEDGSPSHSSGPSPAAPAANAAAALASLGPVERAVAERVAAGPTTADEIAGATHLSGTVVLSALTLLELRGLVVGSWGRYVAAGPLGRWQGAPPGERRQGRIRR